MEIPPSQRHVCFTCTVQPRLSIIMRNCGLIGLSHENNSFHGGRVSQCHSPQRNWKAESNKGLRDLQV